ncbi:aminoglycoside phosphotransferase family protein [Couchioplanes caeruleus]|uniref:phosphotransferase n=1 Tax=Couchioplanes caeruleus TaxID=56438 RepID=UPI0020C1234C|nr:phosphotransferase [Couchioplanes caeruleus]UQU66835.1 aminoglycoside phosphotransferase family protein [Couchioplanes caeruleus]
MSRTVFIKRYTDPARGLAAQRHLRWLQHLDSGVHLPHLYPSTATYLLLERLHGRLLNPDDLPAVAVILGLLHGSAYARELRAARLDQPFNTATGTVIPAFTTGREHVLAHLSPEWSGAPACFYKDANRRNFLITAHGPALVDFDDLTLAPFGYDLAKLIVSTAMTFGHLPAERLHAVRGAYTRSVAHAGGPPASCSPSQLAGYAEVHHLLTARYLHRNDYQHLWPSVRPWPAPAPRTA